MQFRENKPSLFVRFTTFTFKMKPMELFSDEYFMKQALEEAKKAYDEGEVPVGCIITYNNQIIAKAHNLTERLNDVTAHAEIQAITSASDTLGGKYLKECTMYVTLEPCVMCIGAIAWSQISRIVFAASDPQRGYRNLAPNALHTKTQVNFQILEAECSMLVKDFFAKKR